MPLSDPTLTKLPSPPRRPPQVALPLPQPVGFASADDYKLQLSFDGDRVTTHWVQVTGRRAPEAPFLLVEMLRSGDALVSVSARVKSLPLTDPQYAKIKAEFSNPAVWPKHLPVHYSWQARHEVDVDRGLTVLFGAGTAAMLFVALGVVRSYRRQLAQFVDDVAGDVPFASGGGFGGAKAD